MARTSAVLLAALSTLLVVMMMTTIAPAEAFAPRCHPRATARTELARRFSSPFDWFNDAFGNKSKKAEEEAAAKKKAEEEAAAKKKAEEEAAARAAAEAAAQQKAAEEAAAKQRAEEEAAMRIAKAKAEAEAEFARYQAEQKANAEANEAAAAAAREEAEAAAAAEKLAQEEEATANAEADAVAAKVIAEAEASQRDEGEGSDQANDKTEIMSESEGKKYVQEAIENNVRIHGVVQWYAGDKGYGFIRPYRTKAEGKELQQALRKERWQKKIEKKTMTYGWGVFVHQGDIQAPDNTFFRKLYSLEYVEMDMAMDHKGRPVAKNISALDGKYVRRIIKEQKKREATASTETG